jgi:hypothetical protein
LTSKSTTVKRLGGRALIAPHGYAPMAARNHADRGFGGGLGDDARVLIPSACKRSPGRIAFDSVDCSDDCGSGDGVVTRGFAVE